VCVCVTDEQTENILYNFVEQYSYHNMQEEDKEEEEEYKQRHNCFPKVEDDQHSVNYLVEMV
jgi:hypothetical protein